MHALPSFALVSGWAIDAPQSCHMWRTMHQHQYLAKLPRIANNNGRHCIMDKHRYFQLLLTDFFIKKWKHIVNFIAQVEWYRLNLHSACFNLGQIQHIIDEGTAKKRKPYKWSQQSGPSLYQKQKVVVCNNSECLHKGIATCLSYIHIVKLLGSQLSPQQQICHSCTEPATDVES
jgi:hypothetical protein